MGRALGRLAAVLAILAALAAVGYRWMEGRFVAPGPLAEEVTVVLPRGAGLGAIARTLADAGVIERPLPFVVAVRLRGAQARLRAGEYAFPAHASGREVLAMLVEGRTVVHRLTVPEGLTSAEIVALVRAEGALEGMIEAMPPEGTLLPETYHFGRGDSRADLLARMAAAMAEAVAEAWEGRDPAVPLAGPDELVTLASIVEKETGLAAERPRIAAVFYNRLERAMPLQSDPTVVYALTAGSGALGRALIREDLEVESPYNTYRVLGLPPGPIANPGKASLVAVAHPLATDELYFVADGSGGHAFASTLAEHNRNVATWRKLQAESDP
jgi:UPF0755 protein